jgi:hypothetical protein
MKTEDRMNKGFHLKFFAVHNNGLPENLTEITVGNKLAAEFSMATGSQWVGSSRERLRDMDVRQPGVIVEAWIGNTLNGVYYCGHNKLPLHLRSYFQIMEQRPIASPSIRHRLHTPLQ